MDFSSTKDGYSLILNYELSEDVFIKFKKVGEVCEIEWTWSNEAVREETVNSGNVTKVAYDFFEKLLLKFKNTLNSLKMEKIDIDIRESAIKCFPKLEYLNIVTTKEELLNWFLSKSPNLEELTISLRKFETSESVKKNQTLENWKLEKLSGLSIETNVKSVAEQIISKSKSLDNLRCTFYGNDIQEKNEALVNVLKVSSVRNVNIFSNLDDQQFSDLVKSCRYVECKIGTISYSCIYRLIEELVNRPIQRECIIYNVDNSILQYSAFRLERVNQLGLYEVRDQPQVYEAYFHNRKGFFRGKLEYCENSSHLRFRTRIEW